MILCSIPYYRSAFDDVMRLLPLNDRSRRSINLLIMFIRREQYSHLSPRKAWLITMLNSAHVAGTLVSSQFRGCNQGYHTLGQRKVQESSRVILEAGGRRTIEGSPPTFPDSLWVGATSWTADALNRTAAKVMDRNTYLDKLP